MISVELAFNIIIEKHKIVIPVEIAFSIIIEKYKLFISVEIAFDIIIEKHKLVIFLRWHLRSSFTIKIKGDYHGSRCKR